MPNTMPEVLHRIGANDDEKTWDSTYNFGTLHQDVTVNMGTALFPRINIEEELKFLNPSGE
jgi:methionyl-tRNA synthetase